MLALKIATWDRAQVAMLLSSLPALRHAALNSSACTLTFLRSRSIA